MDLPKEIIENVPEVSTTAEQTTPKGVEATPVAELVQTSLAQPPTSDDATVQDVTAGQVDTDLDKTVSKEDVADLTSSGVLPADDNWVGKVKQVIKEDEGKPFKEEEDAEKLNEEYMKNRFNVDVDAPIEEKN